RPARGPEDARTAGGRGRWRGPSLAAPGGTEPGISAFEWVAAVGQHFSFGPCWWKGAPFLTFRAYSTRMQAHVIAAQNARARAKVSTERCQTRSERVLGRAKATAQGRKVLGDGLYDIVSSGFKAADALKSLEASAIAAPAGMTDAATASKAIDAVLNSYHLGA